MTKKGLIQKLLDILKEQGRVSSFQGKEGVLEIAPNSEGGIRFTTGFRVVYRHECGVITRRWFYHSETMDEELYRHINRYTYKDQVTREVERLIHDVDDWAA